MHPPKYKTWLYVMAALYIIAGINHFVNPSGYLKIMPLWLPQKTVMNYVAGASEIFLGIMLIPKPSRRYAAWGIILLLIAVYPANIQMAINYNNAHSRYFWLTIIRLPLQFLLIWWAWKYTSLNNPEAKLI